MSDEAATESTSTPDGLDEPDRSLRERIRGAVQQRLSPSTRSLLGQYALVLLVVLLLVAGAGGFLIQDVRSAPDTETQTETVSTWNPVGSFDHSAEVQRDTAVFAAGDRLENRPSYFTTITPVIEGTYVLENTGDVEADGVVEVELVFQAVEEVDGETFVHWQETDRLGIEEVELEPGGAHTVDFEADVRTFDERIDEIEAELGASPGNTEVFIIAETTLEAELGGDRAFDQRTDRLVIDHGDDLYSIDAELTGASPQQATVTTEVPVEQPTERLYAGGMLLILGLFGALAVGVTRYAGGFSLSAAERRRLTYARARSDYDKWISHGDVPDDDRTVLRLATLEDLVNVAIDSDRRVVESDDNPPEYVVVVDDTRYVFEPPQAAVSGDAKPHPGPPQEARFVTSGAGSDPEEGRTSTNADATGSGGERSAGREDEGTTNGEKTTEDAIGVDEIFEPDDEPDNESESVSPPSEE